jgi:hypothetical protein
MEAAEEIVTLTRQELDRIWTALDYTRATIGRGNAFDTSQPDWVRVHKGRAFQASSYLETAQKIVEGKLRNPQTQMQEVG